MTKWLFVPILLLTVHGVAQKKWSLTECVSYAYNNNITVKQAQAQMQLSELSARQSRMSQYPNLNGSISSAYQHGLTENPTTGTLENTSFITGNINVQAGYNIFSWNARKNTIAANKLVVQAEEAAVERAKNDVALAIANAFLQVMLRREQIRISEIQLGQTSEQLTITSKQVTAGSLPELNAIQLEAQLTKDSANLLQSQALARQALINLKGFLNIDFNEPFDIEAPAIDAIPIENLADLQPAIVYEVAVQTQPLQKMYNYRIEAAQRQVQAARGSMYPSLNAFAGLNTSAINVRTPVYSASPDKATSGYVTINQDTLPVFGPSFVQVGEFGTPLFRQLNRNFGQNLGLSINFSIFNSYNYRTQWERAKVNVLQINLQSEQEKLNLKTTIYNAYQDALASLQVYNAAQRTVSYSKRALDFSKKRFDVGLLGTLDYIITQNNFYLAQIDVITSLYDYIFKMKVLEFYKGQGLKL